MYQFEPNLSTWLQNSLSFNSRTVTDIRVLYHLCKSRFRSKGRISFLDTDNLSLSVEIERKGGRGDITYFIDLKIFKLRVQRGNEKTMKH